MISPWIGKLVVGFIGVAVGVLLHWTPPLSASSDKVPVQMIPVATEQLSPVPPIRADKHYRSKQYPNGQRFVF